MYDMLVTRMIVEGGPALGLPLWGVGLAGVGAVAVLLFLVGVASRPHARRLPGRAPAPVRRLHGRRAA